MQEHKKKYDFIIFSGMWSAVLKKNQLSDVTDLINLISQDAKLIIIMASPKQYDYNPFIDFRKKFLYEKNFDINKISAKNDIYAKQANDLLKQFSKNYSNVVFLDRDLLFKQGEVSTSGIPFTAEGMHTSIYGSKEIAKQFIHTTNHRNLIDQIKK